MVLEVSFFLMCGWFLLFWFCCWLFWGVGLLMVVGVVIVGVIVVGNIGESNKMLFYDWLVWVYCEFVWMKLIVIDCK